jgi:peptidoglycan hydrolase-like protein with peptidoglycan-binding domain
VRQSVPTSDRYKEIQQALVEKGYFRGEADGNWGPDSIDALKRFQQEQNLAPSGKLDSVSLIALGLGPKRNLAARTGPDLNTLPRPQDDNRRSQGSERP